jgi:nucleoside 2-deoxyribosyltransferase
MRRDYRGIEDQSVEAIVQGDIEDIEASDFILVNATRPSWGTAMEIRMAFAEKSKQVILVVDPSQRISPWLRFHTQHLIFTDLQTAVSYINGLL